MMIPWQINRFVPASSALSQMTPWQEIKGRIRRRFCFERTARGEQEAAF